jgi:hypothetical protein
VAKRPSIWRHTVSTSDDSSGGFGKAVDENPAPIIQDILDVFADGW